MILASSPTLEGIQSCIKSFYAGESKTLVPNGKTWEVHGSKGPLLGVIVRYKDKRYRLEYHTRDFNETNLGA